VGQRRVSISFTANKGEGTELAGANLDCFFNENDYIADEHPEIKQLKAIQRQINFHQYAKKNPLIVEADHRILSLSGQPCFKIIESRQMRKDK
jgi:hypothetical protein